MHRLQASVLGIPWDQFPMVYACLALFGIVVSLALRLIVTHVLGSAVLSRPLRPTEIGLLMSSRHSILAAMAQVNAAGLVGRGGLTKHLTKDDTAGLDPLAVSVAHLYRDPRVRTLRDVAEGCHHHIRRMQSELTAARLIAGPRRDWLVGVATAPLLLVLILGVVGIFGTPQNGPHVLLIVVEVVVVLVTTGFLLRPPRLTAAGRRVLREERKKTTYLHPSHKPSLRTYGVAHSGLAAALYGGAALWLLDPGFANASQVTQAVDDTPMHVHAPHVGGGSCAGVGGGGGCGGAGGCSGSGCGGSGGCGGGGCGGGGGH